MAPLKMTAEWRHEHATGNHDDYPIGNAESARRALRLRGHADKALRRKIIRRAAKYVPQAAKKAWDEDKASGAI